HELLKSDDKPVVIIFNKMDEYEKLTFDEWLEPEVKQDLLQELKDKWKLQTEGKCVFISATEKINIAELRQTVLNNVRTMYQVRYPYKAEFFY
ncbi:MAG: GTPase HflX, partial [Ginsengibacter sp.]